VDKLKVIAQVLKSRFKKERVPEIDKLEYNKVNVFVF
jgi:hypothetical protein